MQKLKRIKTIKGATLIETILYLALFGIIFLTVIEFAFVLGRSNDKAQAENEMHRNTIFLNEHLVENFGQAEAINGNISVFDDSNGVLRLAMEIGYKQYQIADSRLIVTDGTTQTYLTSPAIKVTGFTVRAIMNGLNEYVGISITIDFTDNSANAQRSMQSSYILD